MGERKTRILVACVRRAYTRLFAILSGYELTYVTSLADARVALQADDFDLILIGRYFDESRMFDLLQDVRADARFQFVPVACFRGIAADAQGKAGLEGVESACKNMGANAYFDLPAYPDDALGNAAVRQVVDGLLGAV
ncbi:MAG TPA: hypothetical protein VFB96_15750 [Pirellulaceae bacterium]|nr:hypothetical protein [Pirellulaceae bacterium]